MKLKSNQLLKACSLSLALLGSTAIVATIVVPDYAYAKNNKGGGNSGGNGNSANKSDSGKSNGNAGGNNRKVSKSSASGATKSNGKGFSFKNLFGNKKNKSAIKLAKTNPKKIKRNGAKHSTTLGSTETLVAKGKFKNGLHPSQLGNMNGAIHSSPNAKLAHIRNGNFQGPVGLAASLAVADYNYGIDIEAYEEALTIVELSAAFDVLESTTPEEIDNAQADLDLADALDAVEVLETEPDNAEALATVQEYEDQYGELTGEEMAASEEELDAAEMLLDDVADASDLTEGEERPSEEALAEAQGVYDEGEPSTEDILAAEDALLDFWNKGSYESENADEVLDEVRNSLPTEEEIANALPVEDEVVIDDEEIVDVLPADGTDTDSAEEI